MRKSFVLPLIGSLAISLGSSVQGALVVGEAQVNAGNVAPSPITAVSGDLLETSVASAPGENTNANPRNGSTGTAGENTAANPAVIWGQSATTYNLDLSTNTQGYDITSINVFSGWNDDRAAQSYRIFYSVKDDPNFTQLGGDITASGTAGTQRSVMTRTYDSGGAAILSHVDAIQLVQFDGPSALDGTETVYREFDVIGSATVPEPASIPILVVIGACTLCRRNSR